MQRGKQREEENERQMEIQDDVGRQQQLQLQEQNFQM